MKILNIINPIRDYLKHSALAAATAWLAVAALWPARAVALTVNVNLDPNTSRTDLVGPAGGSGETWNQISSKVASGLLDATGGSTAIGFILNAGSGPNNWGTFSLSMLDGASYLEGNQVADLAITGLDPAKTYDLYLASYGGYGDGLWNADFSTANTTPTTSPQIVTSTGNTSTWVQGDNYASFTSVVPDATGKITVSRVSHTGYCFFNGFQIVEGAAAPPRADILTFGLEGNPADITGTNITWTVPNGTDPAALSPTFTMSPGATCTKESGSTQNFTSPVHYIVYSSDYSAGPPTSGTTTDYTVTVVVAPPPPAMQVNVNLDGNPSRTDLVGPAGGSGKTWNQFNTTSASGLLDDEGNTTAIGFTLSGSWNFGSFGTPSLSLLAGSYWWGGGTLINLAITGLDPVKTYDLYLPSYSAYGDGMWNMSFSTANTTPTTSPQIVNGTANSSTWVKGANYAHFTSVVPDGTGTITVSMIGAGGYEFFNGVQIAQTGSLPPQANIQTFGLPGNPAIITGTNITLTVPNGTEVTNLAPTFTLSPGATCTKASGSTQNFTSPVHYIVYSSDYSAGPPTSGTTTDYTVTVVVLPAFQVNVNLDGSTNRTGLVGPADVGGQTWNQFNTSSASGLRDYAGTTTTLGYTLSDPGYFSTWGSPSLILLNGAYYIGGHTSIDLVITGLNPAKTYDLYLPSYSAYGNGKWNMSFSTANTTPSTSPRVVSGSGNSSTWVEGDNYARFTSVVPDGTGTITVSMIGTLAYEFLNGFQIVQTGSVTSSTYATWIAGYPGVGALTGFSDDADGDGSKNGAENFFGTNPSVSSGGLVAGTVSGNTFTFTHPQNATPASDISAAYRWSKDLATFNASGATDGAGTTVTLTTQLNTPVAGTTTVTATVTGTPTTKLFVDVMVTQN
ncbi:MAG: hypothetical protein NTW21_25490 [Verrucomicrobia bacterium]|nr:hypothetical protein [Verrucomicrobiota bacterium]